MNTRRAGAALLAAASLSLTACGGAAGGASPSASAGDAASGAHVDVVASFYPLQFVTERVAGERAAVRNLTPPGAEPHDLELAASDVAALSDADLVVYQDHLQPAVDEAVAGAGTTALDVSQDADLVVTGTEDGTEDGAHDADDDGHGHEHASEGVDPHFWLDPLRLADVGDAVARALAEADPEGATAYTAGAQALRTDLEALDAELAAGLASCTSTDLVTSHAAFGYLAQRYGLTQVGISGLSPDEEPTAARQAEVADLVREHGVTTVYYETLVSPDVAETVADETGARTAVLDPLEGLSQDAAAAGEDYLSVMRANLAALRTGQGCS